jgi:Protein of unknown function (DUF2723)
VLTALVALLCYRATLLPGLDFGDTASFQTGVGSLTLTPRQAYPLYYALGNLFAWLDPREPAHALNLASAVYGAVAVGLATWIAADLAGSTIAGVATGLFLGFSYTFWTQAIIAEVYTLHLLVVGLCLVALLGWSKRPTLGRLALFYAIYALGFGNHLSMILLLPAFTLFILLNNPKGTGNPLQPKAIALALAIAGLGALQYAWNFRGLWLAEPPPSSVAEAFGTFWFDVTKADWRQTLVATVSETGLQNRPAMYWFDLHQQFGVPGVILAVAGVVYVTMRSRRAGLLLLVMYLANLLFAWTYNVGDVHVFFLPSHYVVALCAGAGVAAITRLIPARAGSASLAACVLCLYPAWRGYDTFPAVDRSWDDRPARVIEQFTAPPDAQRASPLFPEAVFGTDMNWQIQNGVEYYMRRHRPDVPWFSSDELPWLATPHVTERFQRLIDANTRLGREVIVTPEFARTLLALGYTGSIGDVRTIARPANSRETLADQLGSLRAGTPYVLGILRPYPQYPIDGVELAAAWSTLTGGSVSLPTLHDYTVVVGKVGLPPVLVDTRDHPYRVRATVDALDFDVRMESWLPTDTIRRAGFGQVVVNHQHFLTLDRGLSFAAAGPARMPDVVAYRSGIFAPIPRLLLGMPGRP